MPNQRIDQAMLMAAGLGKRMQPLTTQMPKPMIKVAGKSMISRIIDKLRAENIRKLVINLHYKAEMLQEHIKSLNIEGMEIIFSYEEELLEAGGIVKALPYFEGNPFFIVNSDILWVEKQNKSVFSLLQDGWSEKEMDALLLVQDICNKNTPHLAGDFIVSNEGQIYRPLTQTNFPFVFCGIYIISPKLLSGQKEEKFTLFKDYIYSKKRDENGKLDRIYAIETHDEWLHVGSVEELNQAEEYLKEHNL